MKRSSCDTTRDPGRGPAGASDPQAGRRAALRRVLRVDRRACGGRRRGECGHDRGGNRHRGREREAAVHPAHRGPADRALRAADPAARPRRQPAHPAPGAPAHRGGRDRPGGRRRGPGGQHRAAAPRRHPSLLRDRHVPPRRHPCQCPRPLPGRARRLCHHDRADRAAGLAERSRARDRRVRRRPTGGAGHDRPVDPPHAAGRARHRPGRQVRRGLGVAASHGACHRHGPVRRRAWRSPPSGGSASPAPTRRDPGTTR